MVLAPSHVCDSCLLWRKACCLRSQHKTVNITIFALFCSRFSFALLCYCCRAAASPAGASIGQSVSRAVGACAVCSVLLLSPSFLLLLDLVASFWGCGLTSQQKACQRGHSANLSPPSHHRSLPFHLLRFPLKFPFLPASGLFFSPFSSSSSHSYPFRPLDTEKTLRILVFHSDVRVNAFEAGANTARARRGPSTYRAELFFFFLVCVWRRFGGVFCFRYCSAGHQSQSVAITILLRQQRYPRKYFPFFVHKLRTAFSC